MENGKYTGELGFRLYNKYKNTHYQVFYDPHRNKKISSPNSCEPTPYFNNYSSETTLANVDVAILDQRTNVVEILIEIEESKAEPKKIIGDIGSIILSDQIRIKGNDYNYGNLLMILGLKAIEKGHKIKKTNNICEKLSQINRQIGTKEMDIITLFDKDLDALIRRVESTVENRFNDSCNV